jgi:hypothetical protein
MSDRLLSGSVPTPDAHSSRRSPSGERGAPAVLAESAEMAVARLKAKMSLGGNLRRSAEAEIKEQQGPIASAFYTSKSRVQRNRDLPIAPSSASINDSDFNFASGP